MRLAEAPDPGFDIDVDDYTVDELREILLSDEVVALAVVPQLLEKIQRQDATIRSLFGDVLRSVALQQEAVG